MAAGADVKGKGKLNDLMERIKKDALFLIVHDELKPLIDPSLFVRRIAEQVDEFLEEGIQPILETNASYLTIELVNGVNV